MSDLEPSEDFEDLYQTAPCGYVSLSPNGGIVKANQTLADWLGRDVDDLLGKQVHDILGFGGRIAFETHLAPLLRMQGYVYEIALDLLKADGEKIPTIANAAEKRSPDGGHLFTRLTLFKAVDRRLYERSLLEAKVRAETESQAQRDAAVLREQFIAVLGHDLRNPLAAIGTGIAMLRDKEQVSERGRRILAEMNNSVSRASVLIDNVLDFARGSLGGGMMIDRTMDQPLSPMLEQVVAEVRTIAPAHTIQCRIAIEEPVFCDRGRLGQLASNLLTNAVTHGDTDKPITFEAFTDEDMFELSVANASEPIDAEVLKHLFQPFFRGKARPSRNGLGLGLFIASEIAKAHGGTLDVSSNESETRFTFKMHCRATTEAMTGS